jgi:flagellar basal-body rod protein FlgG
VFQQIIHVSTDSTLNQINVLDKLSQNLSNINNHGYKAQRFELYLHANGGVDGLTRTDATQGQAMVTRRKLDVAIEGPGYLVVTQPDGQVAYTRNGSLALNNQGQLVTQHGDLVGDGIQLPIHYDELQITQEGTVQVLQKGQAAPTVLGKLTLVRFTNPEALQSVGENKLVATETSGPAQLDNGASRIKQGELERANVNVFHQVEQVLRMNASTISSLRLIKFSDDLYRQAINLRQ